MSQTLSDNTTQDWWHTIPKNVQAEIDEALLELDKGKGIPHETVMKKYSTWFTRATCANQHPKRLRL